jgi:transposase
MVTPPDVEAQILRYYHAEKWKIGTIAAQLHVHHAVVTRVLAQAGLPRHGRPPQPSKVDAYLPFIRQTLEKFPTLTASRLYAMVRERGYRGGPDHFRHLVACHRPRRPAEAYLRLRSLPGEQAQVDWALCRARHRAHYAESRTTPSKNEVARLVEQLRSLSRHSMPPSALLPWKETSDGTGDRKAVGPGA